MAADPTKLDPKLLRIVGGVTISETVKKDKAIYYVIDCMTNQGHHWQVRHRYKDFDEMADDLCQDIGVSHRAELPGKIPRKSLFSGEKIIEKRKKGLATFLYLLTQDQRCVESHVLSNFLCTSVDKKHMPDQKVKTADDNVFFAAETLQSKTHLLENIRTSDAASPSSPSYASSPTARKPGPPPSRGKPGPPPSGGAGSRRIPPPTKNVGRVPPPSKAAGGRIPPPSKGSGRAPPPGKSTGRVPPPVKSAGGRAPPPSTTKTAPPPKPDARSAPPPVPAINKAPSQPIGGPTFSAVQKRWKKPPVPIVPGKKIRKPTNVIANSGSSRILDHEADISQDNDENNMYDNEPVPSVGSESRQSGRKAFPGKAAPDLTKIKLRSTKGGFALGSNKKAEPKNDEMTELQRKMAARRNKVDNSLKSGPGNFDSTPAWKKKKGFNLGTKKSDSDSSNVGSAPPPNPVQAAPPPNPVQSKPPPKPKPQTSTPSWKKKQEDSTPSWKKKQENSAPSWKKKQENSAPSWKKKQENSAPSWKKKQGDSTPSWKKKEEDSKPSWAKKKENFTPSWVKKKKEESAKQDPGLAKRKKHPTPPIPSKKNTAKEEHMQKKGPPPSVSKGPPHLKSKAPPVPVSSKGKSHPPKAKSPPPKKAGPPPKRGGPPPPMLKSATSPAKAPPPKNNGRTSPPSRAAPPPKQSSPGKPKSPPMTKHKTSPPPRPVVQPGRPMPPSKSGKRPPPPSSGSQRDASGRPLPLGFSKARTAPPARRAPPPRR